MSKRFRKGRSYPQDPNTLRGYISVKGDQHKIVKLKKYLNRHGFQIRKAPHAEAKGMINTKEAILLIKKAFQDHGRKSISMEISTDKNTGDTQIELNNDLPPFLEEAKPKYEKQKRYEPQERIPMEDVEFQETPRKKAEKRNVDPFAGSTPKKTKAKVEPKAKLKREEPPPEEEEGYLSRAKKTFQNLNELSTPFETEMGDVGLE